MENTKSDQEKVSFPFYYGFKLDPKRRRAHFKLLKYIFDGEYQLEHIKRCLCGSQELEVLSTQDRFVLPFGTKICKACGLIQISPRLSFKDLPDFYENIYYDLILGESIKDYMTVQSDSAQRVYEYLDKYITDKNKTRHFDIIEIGCGRGALLDRLRKLFEKNKIIVNILGCEPSIVALRMAKQRKINVYQGEVESLLEKKADIVILSHVVEHFGDISKEFEQIKKIFKKDGYLYIEVPGVCYLKNYDYNYIAYTAFVHNYNFNLLSLRSVIEPLGFKFVAGDEYVRSLFQYDPSHICRLDVSKNYCTIVKRLKELEEKRSKENKDKVHKLISIASRIKGNFIKLFRYFREDL